MDLDHVVQEMFHTFIVFRIRENLFCITGQVVQSIQQLPEKLLMVPGAPSYVRGSFKNLGEIVSVVDLRKFFDWKTAQEEYREFADMIEQRKKDHINWVDTLRDCRANGKTFPLSKDCHGCALGVWRDNYHTEEPSINFLLHKLDVPHAKLHELADAAMDPSESGEKILLQMDTELVPSVLNILEEMKSDFQEREFKEMVLILREEKKDQKIALIVDEVLGVESLHHQALGGTPLTNREKNYINGILLRESDMSLVMNLDVDRLYNGIQLSCEMEEM